MTEGVASRAAALPKVYHLKVPLLPPGKNELQPTPVVLRSKRGRLIPLAYVKVMSAREKWSRWIPPAARYRAERPRRVRFIVTRRPGTAPLDEWNLTTGLNLVVNDSLVRQGWLLDDKISVCDLERPVQREALPGETFPLTEILIEDV